MRARAHNVPSRLSAKDGSTQTAAHTRRRARFASRAAAFAAAASAGDSPLPAASEAAAAAAALCPGSRGGLPAPGGFSVFRLRTGVTNDATDRPGRQCLRGAPCSRQTQNNSTGPHACNCGVHRVAKKWVAVPFSCYALVAALLLIVIFL